MPWLGYADAKAQIKYYIYIRYGSVSYKNGQESFSRNVTEISMLKMDGHCCCFSA